MNYQYNNRFVWGLVILIVLIIIVIFSLKNPSADNKVKVGVILALTGTSADASANIKHGVDLATNVINGDSKRRYKIATIFEDDKYDSKEAVNAINKLIKIDKVRYIIGSYGSSQVLAITPIAEENKIVMIVPSAQANKIGEAGDYIFHMNLNTKQEVLFWGPYLAQKLGKAQLSILALNTDLGVSYIGDLESIYPENGGTLGIIQKYEKNENDFRTFLLKIKSSGSKDVLLIGNRQMNGMILKKAKELGYPFNFYATSVTEGKELLDIAGSAAEGLIYPYSFDDSSDDPTEKGFQDMYLNNFGTKSEVMATHGYDSLMILSNCLEKVGDNPEDVKVCLTMIDNYRGAGGRISIDSDRNISRPIIVKIVKDGKFVKFEN